jgi:hypothetical protein
LHCLPQSAGPLPEAAATGNVAGQAAISVEQLPGCNFDFFLGKA